MTMFPNIRILTIEDDVDLDPEEGDDPVIFREENIMFQTMKPSWTSLDIVQADFGGLYAMALQCEVSSLEITTPLDTTTPLMSNHLISDLLRPLRPRHLRFIVQPDLGDVKWGIPVDGLDRLERLDVTVEFDFALRMDRCTKAAVGGTFQS